MVAADAGATMPRMTRELVADFLFHVGIPVLALAGWLIALVSSIGMLAHRDRSKSLWWFAWHGHAFWTMTGFTVDAKPWHRRFLAGALLFFASLFASIFVHVIAKA